MCCDRRWRRYGLVAATVLAAAPLAGCGGKGRAGARPPQEHPVPVVAVGACADPDRGGVVGPAARLEHADRDLDGDGVAELITVDRARCDDAGNCYWNVFVRTGDDCHRFAGSLAGAGLELLPGRGDGGLADVRAYWQLGGGRLLLQDHRFQRGHGGYMVTDTLLCRREADDRLSCAEDDGRTGP